MLGPARSLALDPGLAPHLADRLLTKPGLKVTTTLDRRRPARSRSPRSSASCRASAAAARATARWW